MIGKPLCCTRKSGSCRLLHPSIPIFSRSDLFPDITIHEEDPEMDAEDFVDWQLCWRVNLFFYKPVTKSLNCIPCSKSFNYAVCDTQRSSFWLDGTRCSLGHRQTTQVESQANTSLGICATCDQMYMLDLLKGRYTCRREGCRRTVRVHEAEVKQILASDQVLLRYVRKGDLVYLTDIISVISWRW